MTLVDLLWSTSIPVNEVKSRESRQISNSVHPRGFNLLAARRRRNEDLPPGHELVDTSSDGSASMLMAANTWQWQLPDQLEHKGWGVRGENFGKSQLHNGVLLCDPQNYQVSLHIQGGVKSYGPAEKGRWLSSACRRPVGRISRCSLFLPVFFAKAYRECCICVFLQ